MSQQNNSPAVVVDANVLVAVCAREQDKLATAEAGINDYAAKGWAFYAPNAIVGEVLFAICKKLQDGPLTQTDYDDAVESFSEQMQMILPPPGGASLPDCARQVWAMAIHQRHRRIFADTATLPIRLASTWRSRMCFGGSRSHLCVQ